MLIWLLLVADLHLAPNRSNCADAYLSASLSPSTSTDGVEACAEATPSTKTYRFPTTGVEFSLPETNPANVTENEILPAAPARPPAPDLFRMKAIPIRSGPQVARLENALNVNFTTETGPWTELLSEANRLQVAGSQAIEMVNLWVNWHVRYREDSSGDVWSDARTTLRHELGDCEDIAISKMALLRALGTPPDSMFLVIARDGRSVDHAVLAVRNENSIYILDNRTDAILNDSITGFDYTPIISLSGRYAWTYGIAR